MIPRRWLHALRLAWAAWRFRPARADYYEYLADLMAQTGGRKTLRDLFADDATRHGPRTARGLLAAHWLARYQESGGDLGASFERTLPDEDVLLIRIGQRAGAGAFEQALYDLAKLTRLVDEARRSFVATTTVGLLALLIALLAIAAIPLFTVPRLKQTFTLPTEYLYPLTRRLYALADTIGAYALSAAVGLVAVGYLGVWSLHSLVGPLRQRLDQWAIWRLYRDLQGVRFLSSLATLLRRRGNVSTQLREALALQGAGAGPWLRWHVDAMLARVDAGQVGAATFDTGIVDVETFWYLRDMIDTRGLDDGLQRASDRIERRTLGRVARRAAFLRWVLLLGALGLLMSLALWHVAVIQEMKGALTSFYAGR
jgi:type II secretory pathway component PulF